MIARPIDSGAGREALPSIVHWFRQRRIQSWTLGGLNSLFHVKFLNTIVCYRKNCHLGGHGPPVTPVDSPLGVAYKSNLHQWLSTRVPQNPKVPVCFRFFIRNYTNAMITVIFNCPVQKGGSLSHWNDSLGLCCSKKVESNCSIMSTLLIAPIFIPFPS